MTPCVHRGCYLGGFFEPCKSCAGAGRLSCGKECPSCEGAGEIISGKVCPLCNGTATISVPIMRLYEADRHVRRNNPEWKEDPLSPCGITIYSLALYYRKRNLIKRDVHYVSCYISPSQSIPHVDLLDKDCKCLLKLTGLCWGYGGDGPNGLAVILCDLFPNRFPTHESAMLEVSNRPMEEAWEVWDESE